jgi:hypothetical protein
MTHLCHCKACRCGSDVARPSKICRGRPALQEPPIGAHLITPRRGYTHHGIYAGGGAVLHYAGLSRSIRRGPVAQVRLDEFANGQAVHVECRSEPALDAHEIVARARSRLGESRYRLLTNNCEHFSEWSRFGVSRSRQVERWLGLPLAAVRSLMQAVRSARFGKVFQ